ncbi:MAG: protein-disulfide reductase DsbD domain-containing protein [Acidobacteriota bacterium]
MNRPIHILLSCLCLFVVASCSKPAPTSGPEVAPGPSASSRKVTSESVVKVEPQPVAISPGGSGEAIVRLTIRSGYHVNANPPTYPYLKATTLDIAAGDGVSLAFVTYPKAVDKKFSFADKPLAVYEGTTDLKATLKADKAVRKGERSIPARLRIQACDDQVCYPPGTLEFAIPANVN